MRLTDHDASFLYTETPSTPMHGVSIVVVEGEIDFDTIFAHIDSRLPRIPRYRQRLAFVPFSLAHPQWVDDAEFDLANHVQPTELQVGATIDDAIEQILQLAEPLLPRNRPLWSMRIVSGVPGHTVLAHLAHHAMVDGASGVDISQILFDLQPNPPSQGANESWQPAAVPSGVSRATEAIRENTELFAERVNRIQKSFNSESGELVRRATESMTRFISEPVYGAPWNRSLVGRGRAFRFFKVPFVDIRRIRNRLGGTVNDVALTIVVEAAARYIKSKGEEVGGRHLRIMCPVNVRREDEHGTLGNRVSGIFPVFDAIVMPAVERLQQVRWETEHIKQNREAQALQLLTELMPPMPFSPVLDDSATGGPFGAPALNFATFNPISFLAQFAPPIVPSYVANLPMAGFNFTCTNVPGVQTTQYLAGHKIVDQFAVLMLAGNLGFGAAILSYDQSLYFNLVCNPRLMPDLDLMLQHVETVYHELMQASETADQKISNDTES